MSFLFPSWSTAFSPEFHEDAKQMLEGALNKGNKPPVIQGRIEVVELSMGTQPPTLTLLEIGDLSLDRFRGILRLGYQGDAWLEVRCRVQANPLSHNPNLQASSTLPLSTPLLASQPLLVPMTLRLSKLHLRAILILVVSASKGITLVFKNDPLQNVDVSSTFDSVEVIRGYLQQEIEGQLREMFREDLPGIIHRLSQRWFTGTGAQGEVKLPYTEQTGGAIPEDEEDPNDVFLQKDIFPPMPQPGLSLVNLTPRRLALAKATRERRLSTAASESPTSYTVFPDIEDYDPTYGLRPEGLPTHSGYEAFGRLWEKAREGEGRGLGGLMVSSVISPEEDRGDVSDGEGSDEGVGSLDMMETASSLRQLPVTSRPSSRYEEDAVEWETFPAVGGGLVTRPRVFHSQSQIRAPSEAGGSFAMPSPSGTGGSITARASSIGGASSTIGTLRMPTTPGLGFRANALAGPGPSSLRRLATSRSDVFTHHPHRSEPFPNPSTSTKQAFPTSISQNRLSYRAPPPRTLSGTATSSSAKRTSGSSWDTKGPTPSTSATSSKPMSIAPKSPQSHRRIPSISGTSPGSFPPRHIGPGGITLPLNNSVSQLVTLSHSAHTLSPYARGHEHIAVRSFPHLAKPTSTATSSEGNNTHSLEAAHTGQIKARRKRIFHLGGKGRKSPSPSPLSESLSPDLDEGLPTSPDWGDSSPSRGSDEVFGVPGQGQARRWSPASLTGVAERAMMEQSQPGERLGLVGGGKGGTRPSYGRAPASRSSYGFPPVRAGFTSIRE